MMVNQAECCGRIVYLRESAGAIVDCLPRDESVVRVHHAIDEAEEHPLCDQHFLPGDHCIQHSTEGVR
jgi:hypothetical protein